MKTRVRSAPQRLRAEGDLAQPSIRDRAGVNPFDRAQVGCAQAPATETTTGCATERVTADAPTAGAYLFATLDGWQCAHCSAAQPASQPARWITDPEIAPIAGSHVAVCSDCYRNVAATRRAA